MEKGDKADEKPETANSEASVELDADAIAKAVSEAVAPLNAKIENLENLESATMQNKITQKQLRNRLYHLMWTLLSQFLNKGKHK